MFTTRQVSDLWDVRRDWVIEMARKGDLPAVQLDGRWFVHESVVKSYKRRPRRYGNVRPVSGVIESTIHSLQSATDRARVGA